MVIYPGSSIIEGGLPLKTIRRQPTRSVSSVGGAGCGSLALVQERKKGLRKEEVGNPWQDVGGAAMCVYGGPGPRHMLPRTAVASARLGKLRLHNKDAKGVPMCIIAACLAEYCICI